ncbi:MAG: DUF3048 domain-containing protein [Candidatus Saccharibacteria bacterium]|nr:DUF3048 domain-containing protein [Candidatus Saccharibacteria bacterium]
MAKQKKKEVTIESDLLADNKLEEAPKLESKKSKKNNGDKKKSKVRFILPFSILLVIIISVVVTMILMHQNQPTDPNLNPVEEETSQAEETPKIYSHLTGLEITDASINDLPTFCIQIPNDTYGARPQVGLNKAAIVFEAIAEGGITRLATVWQNLEDSVIGPIRSLRTYYLDWETPFDCTLVHAGGETEARKQAASGAYRDLTESTVYMYRDSRGYKAPDNLFTSTALLNKFNSDKKYTTSAPKVFARQTPEEAEKVAKTVQENAKNASESSEASKNENGELKAVSDIKINFGRLPNFNTVYKYNAKTNSYDRSFESGAEHIVYSCRAGLSKPSPKQECGEPVQLSPNVVIAIKVDEYTKPGSEKRESITTIGSGEAYIFQNGSVIKGTWKKGSQKEQISFVDDNGEEIKLAPGQTWIAAVPNAYGSVKY